MINPVFDIKNIKQESFEFTKGKLELQSHIDDSFNNLDENLLLRLCKWLNFFNENRASFICAYSSLIEALLECSKENDLFKSQTGHEFETSLRFFEIIKNEKLNVTIHTKSDALYLINIALIIGKYPGMIISSLRHNLDVLTENVITKSALLNFFISLFVKYEDPYVLTHNLSKLTVTEIDALMHMLQGNNLRSFRLLPNQISKKESFIFLNKIPRHLKLKTNVLHRAIICSKLANTPSFKEYVLIDFLDNSRVFNYYIEKFESKLIFWKQAFAILCGVNWDESDLSFSEFIDYFEHLSITDCDKTLNGNTPASVARTIHNWHRKAEYDSYKKSKSLSWRGISDKMYLIRRHKYNYRFKEITTGEELFLESKTLNHCVYTYIHWCKKSICSIWSMQILTNESFLSVVTIEIRDSNIVQALGNCNRPISYQESLVIKEWSASMGFKLEPALVKEYEYH